MKTLIKPKKPIHLELELIAVLDPTKFGDIPIAAAKHDVNLEYRDLPIEYQLTKPQLSVYQNWIRSMASIIASYGFDIIDEYQSEDSYSYYITFAPIADVDYDDPNKLVLMKSGTDLLLDVKLRLSNHYLPTGPVASDSIDRVTHSGRMFSEFVVEGVTHDNINTAIKDLQRICQDLSQGDYTTLIEHGI